MLRREAPWWGTAVALVAGVMALAVALEAPQLFSDPNGLDPYVLRLAGVSALMAGVTLAVPGLAAARAVLLAVAAVSVSFSVLAGGPRLLTAVFGARLSGDAQLLIASAGQAIVTIGIAWGFLRRIPADLRPDLRWRRFGPVAAVVTVLGILLLVPIGLAIPASLLGREGIALQAVARDLPWLGPACLLQAFAQELQFRGMLLGALERVARPGVALVVQAAFFGVAHLAIQYPGPVGPFIPVTFGFGLLFGIVVQRTNSLWPAVLIHAAADIAITAAVLPGLYGY